MKLTCGVGYNDGKYPTRLNGDRPIQYKKWRSMLVRCYEPNFLNRNPHYIDCTVSENFKNYSYFYEWYNDNNISSCDEFQVDKDLLIKGNKVYSEDSCVMLPVRINNTFIRKESVRGKYPIGVYWAARQGKFGSCVRFDNRNIALGYFDNELDAFNAYKNAKEFRIKQLAKEYKDLILPKAYNALMNYTVEITD